jgi:lysozyme
VIAGRAAGAAAFKQRQRNTNMKPVDPSLLCFQIQLNNRPARWPIPAGFLLCCGLSLALAVNASGDPVLEGVDVSQNTGSVDWNQVAASGRGFAFAQVSDGLQVDSLFGANYAGIQAAGMIRGAEQFFEPNQDPVAQADLLLAKIGSLGAGDLAPVLDVEVTGGKSAAALAGEIQTWVTTVEQATGKTPVIFTSKTFWNSSVGSSNFTADPLWDAAFGVAVPNQLPVGWSAWQFWQYSENGAVAGINGAADLDRFNGTLSDLDALTQQPTETVPESAGTLALLASALAGLTALRRWLPTNRSGA